MKVKLDVVEVIFLCLTFYEPSIVPHMMFIGFKYLVLLLLLFCNLKSVKREKGVVFTAAGYGAITIMSSVLNKMAVNTIVASIAYAIQIVDIFIVTEKMIRKYPIKKYLRLILWTFLFMAVLTDALMLVVNYDFLDPEEAYFIGNKFVVSYVHCFISALFFVCTNTTRKMISYSKGKVKVNGFTTRALAYGFTIFSFFICWKVTCSTGMIAIVVLLVMMLIPKKIRGILATGKIMVLGVIIMNILIFGTYSLFTTSFFQSFIQNVLGKSSNMTGRMQIWAIIFEQIKRQPIIGYGYFNSVIETILGYGNPQNGILKLLLDTGILGLVFYAFLAGKSFRMKDSKMLNLIYPLIAFMYSMLVVSLAEINLCHMVVFLTMAIAVGVGNNRGVFNNK